MRKIWERIKLEFWRLWVSTWYMWFAAILAIIIGFSFGWHLFIWIFFGGITLYIVYVFLRQIYWWITGKSDYQNGGFPELWKKIFGK